MRASDILFPAVAGAALAACGSGLVGGVLHTSCAICSEIAPLCAAENGGAPSAAATASAQQNVHVYVGGNRLQCLARRIQPDGAAGSAGPEAVQFPSGAAGSGK